MILEDQYPYVGVTNQSLEIVGPRGKTNWIDTGGGNFFDATVQEREIIKKYGSPVVVYPDGGIESTK